MLRRWAPARVCVGSCTPAEGTLGSETGPRQNSLEILFIVCLAPGAEKYFVLTGKGREVGMV